MDERRALPPCFGGNPPPLFPKGLFSSWVWTWPGANATATASACSRRTATGARVLETAHVFGDAALLAWLAARLPPAPAPAMLLFDAPLLCPNATGSRPVDRLTHTLFGRFHAGAHPANAARCPRPLRLAALVERRSSASRVGWRQPRDGPSGGGNLSAPGDGALAGAGPDRQVQARPGRRAARGVCRRLAGVAPRLPRRTRFPELVETPVLHGNPLRLLDQARRGPSGRVRLRPDRLPALARTTAPAAETIGDDRTGFILLPAGRRIG